MAEFNPYSLYSMAGVQILSNTEEIKQNELERIEKAFYDFHKPATYEERKQFVNDALQGRNYNQTLEYNNETMDFEFTEDLVKVTLHSPNEGRDNRYFQYSVAK